MPANTDPIFTQKPDCSTNNGTTLADPILLSSADYTGISANHVLVHTAGVNGSYIRGISFKAVGTNVAAVARIYVNNGSVNTTEANNAMITEISLPATTAVTAAATSDVFVPIERAINPAFRIYVGLGAAVATGWDMVCWAGQY